MSFDHWNIQTHGIAPSFDAIQIIRIDISEYLNKRLEAYTSLHFLDKEELDRYERYMFTKDKNRFAIARYAIKKILSEYLQYDIKYIKLRMEELGKPFLNHEEAFHFNISHSGGIILLGISRYPIGIDVEIYNQSIDHLDLAETVFSAHEIDQIVKAGNNKIVDGFYRCWTKKEAYIKAIGKGLHVPLKNFSVRVFDTGEYNLMKVNWNKEEPKTWKCFNFEIGPNYAAACCSHHDVNKNQYIDFTQYLKINLGI